MPKLLPDAITPEDMAKYLETSDFHLELSVFNSLLSHGISGSYGGTYSDPVTGKDRQYDLRAEIDYGICSLKLAIECKNLKENFPLLITRVPRLGAESYHEVILGRHNSFPVDSGGICTLRNQIFLSGQPVGKSATQVGKALQDGNRTKFQLISNDAETYDKWSQAIASANDLIAKSGHTSLGEQDTVNAAVIFPILIVPDKTLWAADYARDGQIAEAPRQVDDSTLFLGKVVTVRNIKYRISHLLVLTKSAFDGYLDKLRDKHSDEWENLFPDNKTLIHYEREGRIN